MCVCAWYVNSAEWQLLCVPLHISTGLLSKRPSLVSVLAPCGVSRRPEGEEAGVFFYLSHFTVAWFCDLVVRLAEAPAPRHCVAWGISLDPSGPPGALHGWVGAARCPQRLPPEVC